jgi:hypothetical protein
LPRGLLLFVLLCEVEELWHSLSSLTTIIRSFFYLHRIIMRSILIFPSDHQSNLNVDNQ